MPENQDVTGLVDKITKAGATLDAYLREHAPPPIRAALQGIAALVVTLLALLLIVALLIWIWSPWRIFELLLALLLIAVFSSFLVLAYSALFGDEEKFRHHRRAFFWLASCVFFLIPLTGAGLYLLLHGDRRDALLTSYTFWLFKRWDLDLAMAIKRLPDRGNLEYFDSSTHGRVQLDRTRAGITADDVFQKKIIDASFMRLFAKTKTLVVDGNYELRKQSSNDPVVIAAKTIRFKKKATLQVGEQSVIIAAKDFVFEEASRIIAFEDKPPANASAGANGRDAGRLWILAFDSIEGKVLIDTYGEKGADGLPGEQPKPPELTGDEIEGDQKRRLAMRPPRSEFRSPERTDFEDARRHIEKRRGDKECDQVCQTELERLSRHLDECAKDSSCRWFFCIEDKKWKQYARGLQGLSPRPPQKGLPGGKSGTPGMVVVYARAEHNAKFEFVGQPRGGLAEQNSFTSVKREGAKEGPPSPPGLAGVGGPGLPGDGLGCADGPEGYTGCGSDEKRECPAGRQASGERRDNPREGPTVEFKPI